MIRAWISAAAEEEIRAAAHAAHPLETGGLVVGWSDAATGCAVVAEAIGPGPGARHGSASFVPDAAWQADELARRYAASGRVHGYLGDWHTHPGGTGIPSRQDRTTLASIARSPGARAPRPLMLIVAGTPDGPLFVWRHRRWGRRPTPAVVVRLP